MILDEEQRFGVAQKEKLKQLRTEVDVVAMSATPIPRTLNMAMSGLRDISLIETPPRDRQAVETSVREFSEEVVREAILYEIERGGQIYFVHNRVKSIGAFAQWLRKVVPEARVVVGHGQMAERHLEKAMRTFLDGEADVLLATAIIENGLDIPNANTLLVNRADRFGLAQLYQLRGRVGRSDRLAYATFLVPSGQALSATARARLAAITEFCELGAGFRIAARDLEIRGAGNLLGAEQHGFIEAVGFETYCQLLEEAVAELEGRPAKARREVELRLGLDLQLPDAYIPEPELRLSFYKRLSATEDEEAVAELIEEIVDRYGPAPSAARDPGAGAAGAGGGAADRSDGGAAAERPLAGQARSGSAPPERLGEVLTNWPEAQLSPSGEITVPAGRPAPRSMRFSGCSTSSPPEAVRLRVSRGSGLLVRLRRPSVVPSAWSLVWWIGGSATPPMATPAACLRAGRVGRRASRGSPVATLCGTRRVAGWSDPAQWRTRHPDGGACPACPRGHRFGCRRRQVMARTSSKRRIAESACDELIAPAPMRRRRWVSTSFAEP